MLKFLKILVFAVGTYYILKFLIRMINANRKKNTGHSNNNPVNHPSSKKPTINPDAGEYTDYEEIKD